MIHAYSELYIEGMMIKLGDMLEYACIDCGYDLDAFWQLFLRSRVSIGIENGNPKYIAGMSGVELAQIVMEEVDYNTDFAEPSWNSNRSDIYWCGWVLAYYQWYCALSFKIISEKLTLRMLRKMYGTLHEADIHKCIDVLDNMAIINVRHTVREWRQIRNWTQNELAQRAQVDISQIQRLEYGERKLENMTLKAALNIANALGVRIEQIA